MARIGNPELPKVLNCGICSKSYRGSKYHLGYIPYQEGPSTQYLRFLAPKTLPCMVFGTKIRKYWVLGPSRLNEDCWKLWEPPAPRPACRAALGALRREAVCRGEAKASMGLSEVAGISYGLLGNPKVPFKGLR